MFGLDNKLSISNFFITSKKIYKNTKILFISDIHSSIDTNDYYILDKLQDIDNVILGGDIIDSKIENEDIFTFLQFLKNKFSNINFVLGNHESSKKNLDKVKKISLFGNYLTKNSIKVNENIKIYGLDDSTFGIENFENKISSYNDSLDQELYNILISHEPHQHKRYVKTNFDLILSGDAHGGQIRIFGRGLFAPRQGFFPKYTKGLYQLKFDQSMIVSTGITTKKYIIPRLFNPREICIINFIAK